MSKKRQHQPEPPDDLAIALYLVICRHHPEWDDEIIRILKKLHRNDTQ
jgi:hypothetical protein